MQSSRSNLDLGYFLPGEELSQAADEWEQGVEVAATVAELEGNSGAVTGDTVS